MINTTICLVVKFLLLLHLSKERLFDVIKRDNGRCTLKSCLAYIANLKEEERFPGILQNIRDFSKVSSI